MLGSLKSLVFTYWRYALGTLMFLVLGGYFFLGRGANPGATFTIISGDFREQVSISGAVVAAKDAKLGFAANGRIFGVYAHVGAYVQAGTILAETENGDLAADVTQKQAALAQAQANLASLKTGTRSEEIAVAAFAVANAEAALVNAMRSAYTASDDAVRNRTDSFFINPRTNPKLTFVVSNAILQATVEHSRTNAESALVDWGRLVDGLSNENLAVSAKQAEAYLGQITALLVNANAALNQGVPDQTVTAATLSSYGTTLATARTNVDAAATALTAAIATLDDARSTLALKKAGSTPEAIAAQEAAVAIAAADVRSAQAKLAATRVVAPFSGTVTRMDAQVGEIVSPNTSEISLQSSGTFQVETYIPEVNIARVAVGNTATTTLDAYGSSIEFPAQVVSIDPAETVKDGVPTYKTVLTFLTADPRIRSGMTANVRIVTGMLRDTIVIPSGAIGTKNGVPYVSVVTDDGVVARTVSTGPSPALGQAHVISGLSRGDIILLTPSP